MKKNNKKEKKETIEEQYQKVTQYEHILKRPDTYIGSIEFQKERLWVYNSEEEKLEFREVKYVPGLFKIFDEILVNAADNYQNDKSMKYIKVDINRQTNTIKVKNGGKGIPITIHKKYNMYVPQLIFGNLLTSSNYNDDVKKVTGGRNGYGAKLTNIYSKTFIVETADKETGKRYKQKFYNNMLKFNEPEIEDYGKDDFTCITFQPDLERFRMTELDDDIVAIFEKRVFDMAGITPKSVSVYLNGKKLNVKNFEDYIHMYLDASKEEDEMDLPMVYECPHERWEVGMSLSESQFQQVSFVNAISTTKGGKHVDYVTDKIIKVIMEKIAKKDKNLNIKPQHIKQHLWIFVNCLIENPAFSSQTKETLISKKEDFGSEFEFSDSFLKNVIKTNIVERCLRYAKTREEEKNLRKLNSGTKKNARLIGIEKLDDANWAGTKNSSKCTLILTEGDSAKSLAMAGIEVVGRDSFGCFPLRGKLLNVRECSTHKILKNQEIQYLMKILGIKVGETYTDVKNLRYGSILIMTDQDVDGSHIKGLIINFIHTFWPSLIKLNGFMRQFITPILKATKGKEVKSFYTIPEYEKWVKSMKNIKGWKIKYYKGLGTSSNKEAQEYFANIQRHRIDFEYKDEKDDESIDMAFNKKKAEERKNWLMNFDPNTPPLNLDVSKITYNKFINRELILFSMYDNQRCIPCLCDGLKPSERKILYGCFKKNLREEIKVAQLVGYISEHTAYKHGEQSLAGTIVAMAQNFVGSNNINLLMPNGQFGTRNKGGKDSASSRYIFTELNKVTRHLFNQNDSPLMDYIFEEGQKIEPKWYLPIIPMILVNGCEGIGTGWRSQLPCFNPHEIVRSLKSKLKGNGFLKLEPWYKGFQGEIKENPENKGTYIVTGKYHWDENNPRKVIITEIPIKKWTEDYKYFLQELMGIEIISRSNNEDNKSQKKKGKNNGRKRSQDKSSDDEEKQKKKKKEIMVEDLRENHTYNRVCFEVTLLDEYAKKFKQDNDLFIKTFNLQSTINIKNMVLFSPEGKLKKYNTIEEILETFYNLRLEYYHLRKDYMISVLKKEVATLSNKARFIKMVIEDELIIKKKKRAVIVNELYELKFDTQSMLDAKKQKTKEELHKELEIQNNNEENNLDQSSVIVNEEEQENKKKGEIKPKVPIKEYDYLLSMNLWSLTHEKIEELLKQKELKEKELSILEQTEVETLWDNDLDNLEEELTKYENMEEEDRLLAQKLNKGKSGGAIPKRRRGGRKKKNNSGEKSEDNNSDNDNENNDSNNTSLISDSTNIITKKNKSPNKTRKTRKKKNQASITEFVEEKKDKKSNKKTDKEIDMDNGDSVSKNSKSGLSSDNNKESSDDDDESSESNQFKIPLKERLRKKIIDIGESPIPLENLNYGTKIKRDFSDDSFSDLDLGYLEEKEKKEE